MNFRFLFFGWIAFVSSLSFSQKYDPGKVTVAMLEQKRHPKDSSAAAAILYKIGETRFDYRAGAGFSMVTECSYRIKIYRKEGYDWGNFGLPFYTGEEVEKVSFSDAYTYNLVGGKVERSKLKSDGEFVEKTNKNWSRRKITMPNVREGSIVEFSYKLTSPYFQNMPDWSFQASIPVDYCEFRTTIPEYYIYQPHLKGSLQPKTTVSTLRRVFERTEREHSKTHGGMQDATYKMDYEDRITTYILADVPALNDEVYVNNLSNYTASVVRELSSVKLTEGGFRQYSSDWASVVNTIYTHPDFGEQLSKDGYYENELRTALGGAVSETDRITAIFDLVRDRMTWDGYSGYYCDAGVKKAFQDKTGNVAEINLMLTAMLRKSGFDAHPVLVSTRSNGVSIYPALTAYNYVISAVQSGGKLVLLDATDKWSVPDVLPTRDLNWFGRIIRTDGSSDLIDLMPQNKSREVVNLMGTIDQGILKGQLRSQYYDHHALEFRSNLASLSESDYLERLESKFNGLNISDYKRDGVNDLAKPLTESYNFESAKVVELVGDRLYFSPMGFLAARSNPFRQSSRDYPIDFVYPNQEKYNISINIPPGYAIESVPQVLNLAMPDNMGSFKFIIQSNEKSVQVAVTCDINEAIIPATQYEALRDFFQKMVDKQNEKIVLKKI